MVCMVFCCHGQDQDEGNVSQFRGKRLIGVVASGTEVGGEKQRFMNKVFKIMGYHKMYTLGPYGHDSCCPSQALGDSCDAPAPSGRGTPDNGPTAPSAVPRRGRRSFLAPMRGSAMLVRPRLANRIAGYKLCL